MNKYEIIGIVGEGAYGIVYKAKCKETGEFGKSIIDNISPSALRDEALEKIPQKHYSSKPLSPLPDSRPM